MIKEHNTTGMKYLCITRRDDYINYVGSGKYWVRHINKHGKDINTTVLFEDEDYYIFVKNCKYYSEKYDVAKSNKWANIIPEYGYDNRHGDNLCYNELNNFQLWWDGASDEEKSNLYKIRGESIKENHWTKNLNIKYKTIEKISKASKITWEKLSTEKQKNVLDKLHDNYKIWRDNISDDDLETYNKLISKSLKRYYIEMSVEDKKLLSEDIIKRRLNLSDEKKEERKRKIRAVYATGKHDELYKRYKTERLGGNNPNAKPIKINEVTYETKGIAAENLGITRRQLDYRLKVGIIKEDNDEN